jgi:hypothetical protein
VTTVADAEKAQILRRVEEALVGNPEEDIKVVDSESQQQHLPGQGLSHVYATFLEGEKDDRERTDAFLRQLQLNVWEGLDKAVQKRQQEQ